MFCISYILTFRYWSVVYLQLQELVADCLYMIQPYCIQVSIIRLFFHVCASHDSLGCVQSHATQYCNNMMREESMYDVIVFIVQLIPIYQDLQGMLCDMSSLNEYLYNKVLVPHLSTHTHSLRRCLRCVLYYCVHRNSEKLGSAVCHTL